MVRRRISAKGQGIRKQPQRHNKNRRLLHRYDHQWQHPSPNPLEQELLTIMHGNRSPMSLQEMMRAMGLKAARRKPLKDVIAGLLHRQVLTVSRKGLYALRHDSKTMEGVIEMHPRGFGFVVLDQPPAELRQTGERNDPFVSPRNLGTANHGDRVLVAIISRRRERPEARVLQVLVRSTRSLAGILTAGRDTGLVTPEDERITFKVIIQRKDYGGAKSGNAVIVEITDYRGGQRNPLGRITKVLGDPENINVQALLVASKFGLPYEFEPETIKDSEKLATKPLVDRTARENLLDVAHVTIDGETARDFDDAVAVIKTGRGYRLYVSIADVSHYVRPGTPIDREAYRRGTSVYFPTMVLPMLPEVLSNDLCSLRPDTERLAFTAGLDFDPQGHRLGKRFFKSVIKSRYRLTYTEVKQMVVDRARQLRRKYKSITTQLDLMAELAAQLERGRLERGSIGFTLPEAELQIDEGGRVTAVVRSERNLAHKIIEEFMLAANEAVAQTLAEKHTPALYRIHEPPDSLKVAAFTQFAATLGMALVLPRGSGSPQWFGQVLAQAAGTPKEYIINNLLLRTMQRARYSPENVGHFGLAASHYTHFTSPIRRYPDLMVHRALTAIISDKVAQPEVAEGSDAQLVAAGDFLSGREKNATAAEWEMVDRLKVRFMADKVGQTFDGIVSGATDFGLFVELIDWFVGGAISMADLDNDHYVFDEKHHCLIGRYTGTTYQIGDLVRVTVKSVEVRQRRVNFVIAPPWSEEK